MNRETRRTTTIVFPSQRSNSFALNRHHDSSVIRTGSPRLDLHSTHAGRVRDAMATVADLRPALSSVLDRVKRHYLPLAEGICLR